MYSLSSTAASTLNWLACGRTAQQLGFTVVAEQVQRRWLLHSTPLVNLFVTSPQSMHMCISSQTAGQAIRGFVRQLDGLKKTQ